MAEIKSCWLCGKNGSQDRLEKHHIFGGPLRDKSEKYGCYVWLCGNECHRNGRKSAHHCKETATALKQYAQAKVMKEQNWTLNEFRAEFGKNYLEDIDE